MDALTFSGGYNWGEYRTITLEDIPLSAGANTISLIYNSSKGSTNWLNLDQLVLTQQD